MWNRPTSKQLALIPDLYQQENVKDKKVYIKFFMGAWAWYVVEFDKKDTFFAFVISPMEPQGEFGYVSFNELQKLRLSYVEVDRDLHQVTPRSPKRLSEMLREDRIQSPLALQQAPITPQERKVIVDKAIRQKQGAMKSFEYIGRQMQKRQPTYEKKIPVKQVMLKRVEGVSNSEIRKWYTFPSFAEANKKVRGNAQSAPKTGGYDKHDFKVIWADGKTYEGRLDVKHPSQPDNDNDIG